MEKEKELSKFLNRRRIEISEAEGREWNDLLTWRALATRCGIAENTLYRIQKGHGLPNTDNLFLLAPVFGYEIFDIMGVHQDLAWLIQHQDNPEVKGVIRQAMEHAKKLQQNPTKLSELGHAKA